MRNTRTQFEVIHRIHGESNSVNNARDVRDGGWSQGWGAGAAGGL